MPEERNASSLSSDMKRELVQRVIHSDVFRRSSALCAFLFYITEHAILGRTDKIRERAIGTEVLGRKANYNASEDNIVRVRAHELRGRLDRYFATEGSHEPVMIVIPRGAYAPEFVPRRVVDRIGEMEEVKRLRDENARLKRLVADLILEIDIARTATRKLSSTRVYAGAPR
jgi:hypothetical protein